MNVSKKSRIFLYGAGRNGKRAYYYLCNMGLNDNIVAFIDNNPKWNNHTRCGLNIAPIDKIKKDIAESDVIVLTPDMETSVKIFNSLYNDVICKILFWNDIERLNTEDLESIINDSNVYRVLAHSQKCVSDMYMRQAKFLACHSSAINMKPATGELRHHQLELIKLANDFMEQIKSIDVKPYLEGGNLLGYIRHNGFIPWDDDFDMTVVREEYEVLKDYCANNLNYYKYSGSANNYAIYEWMDEVITDHKDQIVVIDLPLRIRIHRSINNGKWMDEPFIDIIPLDSYRDGYSYEDRLNFLDDINDQLESLDTADEQRSIIEEKLAEDQTYRQKDGEHLYFGLDSLEGYFNRNKVWFERDNIFPLQKAEYEGMQFWIPNRPKEYLEAEFGPNLMELPENAALHVHRSF